MREPLLYCVAVEGIGRPRKYSAQWIARRSAGGAGNTISSEVFAVVVQYSAGHNSCPCSTQLMPMLCLPGLVFQST